MATIAVNYNRLPELGPDIYIEKSNSTKPRALLGWLHHRDNPQDHEIGKLWCWTSEGDRFQVFDENFNRSEIPGDVRDCGVASFTMVRMFHPYWCRNGHAPQDMNWTDKRWCREKYRKLLRDLRPAGNGPGGNDDDDDDDDDNCGDTHNDSDHDNADDNDDNDDNNRRRNDDDDDDDYRSIRSESSDLLDRIRRGFFNDRRDEYFAGVMNPVNRPGPLPNRRADDPLPVHDSDSDSDDDVIILNQRPRNGGLSACGLNQYNLRSTICNSRPASSVRDIVSPKRESVERKPDILQSPQIQPVIPAGVQPPEGSLELEFISSTVRHPPRLNRMEGVIRLNPRSNSMPLFGGQTLTRISSTRSNSVAFTSIEVDVVSVKSEGEIEESSAHHSHRQQHSCLRSLSSMTKDIGSNNSGRAKYFNL